MITRIEPERGGESEGVLRVELSLPMARSEVTQLRDWLRDVGFSPDVDQLNAYLDGYDDWQG